METKTLILPTQSTINDMYSELGTSEAKMELDVKILKDWMRKQPHLPNPDDEEKIIDEKRIKMFLVMCKNSLEKTKEMLDKHYTIKLSAPEYFTNWDPTSPEIIQAMKLTCWVPLPKPTHEGYRVSLYCLRSRCVDKFNFRDIAKLSVMTYELRIAKLDTYKKDIFIYDLDNLSMNHVTAILPSWKKANYCAKETHPLRIHEIHIVNSNSYIQPLINITLSLLSNKMSDKVYNHKSIENLKKYIDPSILPPNYGGTYPKTSDEIIDDWHDEMIKHKEWLIAQSSIVADKSKRPKNSNNNLDSFENAIEGSFRKLEVD